MSVSPLTAASTRLKDSYPSFGPDWSRYFSAKYERGNFASRYHFVYPGLAYFVQIRDNAELAHELRPTLDVMFKGLTDERCWRFWHTEMGEATGAIAERNLTYAGRLALFVGLYIDAFGEAPASKIEVDGEQVTYSELSTRLWRQMVESPSCGVSCYNRESMVMCNAVLLMNNVIHDRLFGSSFSDDNDAWVATVEQKLVDKESDDALFFFGTQPDSREANRESTCLGLDAWGLALMAATVPDKVRDWYVHWKRHVQFRDDRAWVNASEWESKIELCSSELASCWALCLAAELGERELHRQLNNYLEDQALIGFRVDPYMSGLYVLGQCLKAGGLYRLVNHNA